MTARPDLCGECHVAPPERGRYRCAPCAVIHREREAKRREDARARKLCLVCAGKVRRGRRYCAAHLAYYARRAAAAWRRRAA